eukprot:156947_1
MCMVKRLTLLTMISLFTSCFFIFTAIFEVGSLFSSIDTIINNWFVILVFKYYDNLYNCIVGKCCNVSDNCLSCFSLNICCPIKLHVNDTNQETSEMSQTGDLKHFHKQSNQYELAETTEISAHMEGSRLEMCEGA